MFTAYPMTPAAARLLVLLLVPAVALSLTIDTARANTESFEDSSAPDKKNRQHHSVQLENGESPCHGRGNATDEEFLGQCNACRLAGTEVPRLYIMQPNDGVGSRFQDIIAGMAIASRMGMALGGVTYGKHTCKLAHGIDVMKTAGMFFGLKNMRLMFTNHPPNFTRVYPGISTLEKGLRKYGRPQAGEPVFLSNRCLACELDGHAIRLADWYTPTLLHELRKANGLKTERLEFQKGRTSIAIHVRRGDVASTDKLRGTSDFWYFSIINQLYELIPDADIHVFTSLEGNTKSSDFDDYREMVTAVHTDNDIISPWAHFARADVLVTAKSSFSHVPAMINKKCVVYQPYWHRPLDGWIKTSESIGKPLNSVAQRELVSCLALHKAAPQTHSSA